MNHVELARGSMRPIRYGIAGMFLLCIACGLSVSLLWERVPKAWMRWSGLALATGLLLVQVRPDRMSPNLAWPPWPSLALIEGQDSVLDLPLAGANERRFAYWAYHPAPRMNPPHDLGRWHDAIRVPAGGFPLLTVLDDLERGRSVSAARLEALQGEIPEVETHGLRYIVLHKSQLSPQRIADLAALLNSIGAERISVKTGIVVYALSP
jgi:hypothetical protein